MASPTDAEEHRGNVVHSHVVCDASQAHSLESTSLESTPPPPYSITTGGIDQNCCPCRCALDANRVDRPVRNGQDTRPLCSTTTPPSYDALLGETCDHQRLPPTSWARAIAVRCSRISRSLNNLLSRHKEKDGYVLLEMGHPRPESLLSGQRSVLWRGGRQERMASPAQQAKRDGCLPPSIVDRTFCPMHTLLPPKRLPPLSIAHAAGLIQCQPMLVHAGLGGRRIRCPKA
ncbi:hypothetical protein B0J18DRAFT_434500 [Chaetomium sp. MPI-SDFR-AT-0129]|nr:hypothetical protein B0J18DRAFT_434500 [Chaetomium sp. MPI-SDFR-AT-0129]